MTPPRDLARVYDAAGDAVNVAPITDAVGPRDPIASDHTHDAMDALRVLEIGHASLFARELPRTTLLWTGRHDVPPVAGRAVACGVTAMMRLGRALRSGAFDLVVCHAAPEAPFSRRAFRRVVRRARRERRIPAEPFALLLARACGRTPLAVLDLEDGSEIAPHNAWLARAATVVFKRELAVDDGMPTLPISLGLSVDRRAAADAAFAASGGGKSVDVLFAGSIRDGDVVRRRGIAQLEALRSRGYVIDVAAARLPLPEYMRRSAAAWLTWSPPGLGWDCFRHYEAAACGSVPVMTTPTIRRHRPLLDRVHALVYDPAGDDLPRVIVAALADRARLASMAGAARQHVRTHHSHRALCAYVADACRATAPTTSRRTT